MVVAAACGTAGAEPISVVPHHDAAGVHGRRRDRVQPGGGLAGLLEVALTVAEQNLAPARHLRFAWWGAEELGLLGSTHYVESLPEADRAKIAGYVNFDMIGSPNAGYFVYDSTSQPDGSEAFEKALNDYFASISVPTEPIEVGGRSDHAAFADATTWAAGTHWSAGSRRTWCYTPRRGPSGWPS